MIPRVIHTVWVGDEKKRPDNCIATWRERNPAWEIRVWGNAELEGLGWINKRHMAAMQAKGEWNGVADLMRWEILLLNGGFAVDADSICLRALEDWLFESRGAAGIENEHACPGLLAAGYVATEPHDRIVSQIVDDVSAASSVTYDAAWVTVGPKRLTDTYDRMKLEHRNWRIWPSHYFIPTHHSGVKYTGPGPIFAEQRWGTTFGIYDGLHQERLQP